MQVKPSCDLTTSGGMSSKQVVASFSQDYLVKNGGVRIDNFENMLLSTRGHVWMCVLLSFRTADRGVLLHVRWIWLTLDNLIGWKFPAFITRGLNYDVCLYTCPKKNRQAFLFEWGQLWPFLCFFLWRRIEKHTFFKSSTNIHYHKIVFIKVNEYGS